MYLSIYQVHDLGLVGLFVSLFVSFLLSSSHNHAAKNETLKIVVVVVIIPTVCRFHALNEREEEEEEEEEEEAAIVGDGEEDPDPDPDPPLPHVELAPVALTQTIPSTVPLGA